MDKVSWEIERELLLQRIEQLQDECEFHVQCRREQIERLREVEDELRELRRMTYLEYRNDRDDSEHEEIMIKIKNI